MTIKIITGIVVAGLIFFGLIILTRQASNDRIWEDEFAYTNTSSVAADGTVTIKNVRDFTYGDGTILAKDWLGEVRINPKDIVRTWFILEPFGEWKAVGHTYLTFELADGSAYSFSVEARREKGEPYSAWEGLFRKYELAYTWGTERDFMTRRLLYLKHPVRMYPLAINAERSQELFSVLLEKTNGLAEHPRFYNTVTANCTNVLAEVANDLKPGSIPYDVSWNLPGSSDKFLLKIGFIKTNETFEQMQQSHDLTQKRQTVLGIATSTYTEFGRAIRSLIPSPVE